jgi:hypothetical protein
MQLENEAEMDSKWAFLALSKSVIENAVQNVALRAT